MAKEAAKTTRPKEPGTELAAANQVETGTAIAVSNGGQLAAWQDAGAASESEYLESMQQISAATQSNIQVGEVKVSRISIAQPATPEVAKKETGWEAGQLFDSMNREVLSIFGKPKWLLDRQIDPADVKACWYLPFVAIFRLPSEYIAWPTKEEREAGERNFHWKDLDPASPRVREGMWKPKGTWVGEGTPPVTEHLNVLGFGLDLECQPRSNLVISSFSRTSFRTGEKLVTALQQHRMSNLPWWGRVYYLYTDMRHQDSNTWYELRFAKGPKLMEFGVDVEDTERMAQRMISQNCFQTAKMLSVPGTGREMQELFLGSAAFADEDIVSGGGTGNNDDGTIDPEGTDKPTF